MIIMGEIRRGGSRLPAQFARILEAGTAPTRSSLRIDKCMGNETSPVRKRIHECRGASRLPAQRARTMAVRFDPTGGQVEIIRRGGSRPPAERAGTLEAGTAPT